MSAGPALVAAQHPQEDGEINVSSTYVLVVRCPSLVASDRLSELEDHVRAKLGVRSLFISGDMEVHGILNVKEDGALGFSRV